MTNEYVSLCQDWNHRIEPALGAEVVGRFLLLTRSGPKSTSPTMLELLLPSLLLFFFFKPSPNAKCKPRATRYGAFD
jgi:hypothetical protein